VGVGERTSRDDTSQGTIVFVAKSTDGRRSADKPKEQAPKENHKEKIDWHSVGGGRGGFCGQQDAKKKKNINFCISFLFLFFGSCPRTLAPILLVSAEPRCIR